MSTNKNYLAKTNKYIQKYNNFRGGFFYTFFLHPNIEHFFQGHGFSILPGTGPAGSVKSYNYFSFIDEYEIEIIKNIIKSNPLFIFTHDGKIINFTKIIYHWNPSGNFLPHIIKGSDQIPLFDLTREITVKNVPLFLT